MRFYSEEPRIFSFFKCYQYPKVDSIDQSIIQPFLNHLFLVIWNHDTDLYNYIIAWISLLFQFPNDKLFLLLEIEDVVKIRSQMVYVKYLDNTVIQVVTLSH